MKNLEKFISRRYKILENFTNSERSDECIDFTMIITSRNNVPISNFGGAFRCKSEYPWCIIEVKSKHFPTVFKKIEKKKNDGKREFLRKISFRPNRFFYIVTIAIFDFYDSNFYEIGRKRENFIYKENSKHHYRKNFKCLDSSRYHHSPIVLILFLRHCYIVINILNSMVELCELKSDSGLISSVDRLREIMAGKEIIYKVLSVVEHYTYEVYTINAVCEENMSNGCGLSEYEAQNVAATKILNNLELISTNQQCVDSQNVVAEGAQAIDRIG
ncbi:interferon-inducible double-stranded RNA-dependent protein kinase activator A [Aphis craccivora]|uniref:Interferon-inducible double-stranded RNA-dependent protein kinase activator A n=1 Tax=Aphis craccivora TaxID=307492 RepID=A0A6G0Y9C3_APHCR|nr:interferon-inducible double-stranded RNA-dependent protein kinase activator A [Aphis craccivora]